MSDTPATVGARILRRHMRFLPQGPILARASRVSAFADRRAGFVAGVLRRWSRRDADEETAASWFADAPVAHVRVPDAQREAPWTGSPPEAIAPGPATPGKPAAHLARAAAPQSATAPDISAAGQIARSSPAPRAHRDNESPTRGTARSTLPRSKNIEPTAWTANGAERPDIDDLPAGSTADTRRPPDAPLLARARRLPGATPTVYRHPQGREEQTTRAQDAERRATRARDVSPQRAVTPSFHAAEEARSDGGNPAPPARTLDVARPSFPIARGASASAAQPRRMGSGIADSRGVTTDRQTGRPTPAVGPITSPAVSVQRRHAPREESRGQVPRQMAVPWFAAAGERRATGSADERDVAPGPIAQRVPLHATAAPAVRAVSGASIARALAPVSPAAPRADPEVPRDGSAAATRPAAPDLDEIVERVVERLSRQVAIEAERRGVATWRSRS